MLIIFRYFLSFVLVCWVTNVKSQSNSSTFKVVSFFTARNDRAHISFLHEANKWFSKMSALYHFQYDSTQNWDNLNPDFLSKYQVVIFLDTRPDSSNQREAFQHYMENGGAWMGFHFSG